MQVNYSAIGINLSLSMHPRVIRLVHDVACPVRTSAKDISSL